MTRDFMQTKVYAQWAALGMVVHAKLNGGLDQLIARAKKGEGEIRQEDIEQAAIDETLLGDDERGKIAFFVTAARERAQMLANQGRPRSGKR